MPVYRFYRISAGNHILDPGEERDFDNDSAALAHAKAIANGAEIDVWQDGRLIAHVAQTYSAKAS